MKNHKSSVVLKVQRKREKDILTVLSMDDVNVWKKTFDERIRANKHEQFSVLVCELEKCDAAQKHLLEKLLFVDHRSTKYWDEYVAYVWNHFPAQKLKLQRLVNKALDMCGKECDRNNDPHFVRLHLFSASLKDDLQSLKYFQNVIVKSRIGLNCPQVYVAWAKIELQVNGTTAAMAVLLQGLEISEPKDEIQNFINKIRDEASEKCDGTSKVISSSSHSRTQSTARNSFESNSSVPQQSPMKVPCHPRKKMTSKMAFVVHGEDGCDSDDDTEIELKSSKTSKNNPVGATVELTSDDSQDTCAITQHAPPGNRNQKKRNFSSRSVAVEENQKHGKPSKQLVISNSPSLKVAKKSVGSREETTSNFFRSAEMDEADSDDSEIATIALPPLSALLAPAGNGRCAVAQVPPSHLSVGVKSIVVEPRVDNKANGGGNQKRAVCFVGSHLPQSETTASKEEQKQRSQKFPSDSVRQAADHGLNAGFKPDQVSVNNKIYAILGMLGKGGSSSVYRVMGLSPPSDQLCAFKRVDVKGVEDAESVLENYANEISILKRLNGSKYIITLLDAEIDTERMRVSMIMEAGEADLAKVLTSRRAGSSCNSQHRSATGLNLNPFFTRMVWQEMLEAVDYIHENRIVHGDLKPANFVFVKGHLKLIDFGIAKAIAHDNTTNIYRESQIGTINYMAPEAIVPFEEDHLQDEHSTDQPKQKEDDNGSKAEGTSRHIKLGRASDIWSLGCILYQMLFGRPPFAALNTIQKLHAIPNPLIEISYPDHPDKTAVESAKLCLRRPPKERAPISGPGGLLDQPFLSLTNFHADRSLDVDTTNCNTSANMGEEQVEKIVNMVFQAISASRTTPNLMEHERSSNLPPLPPQEQRIVDQIVTAVSTKMKEASKGEASNNPRPISVPVTSAPVVTNSDKENAIHHGSAIKTHSSKKSRQPQSTDSKKAAVEERKGLSAFRDGSQISSNTAPTKPRLLPTTLKTQISNGSMSLQAPEVSGRATKWRRQQSPEKNDLKSVLERQLCGMRMFMNDENDQDLTDYTDSTSNWI